MVQAFKVIETVYDGYNFRSRLEARWAVFFNALDIKYEYEKEGYQLQSWYLPDFWLPEQDCWIEIKGNEPTSEEQSLAYELGNFTNKNVYIFFGEIPNPDKIGFGGENNKDSAYMCYPAWDNYYAWTQCPHCSKLTIQYSARSDRTRCKCPKSPHGDKGYNGNSPNLLFAYLEARQERF